MNEEVGPNGFSQASSTLVCVIWGYIDLSHAPKGTKLQGPAFQG